MATGPGKYDYLATYVRVQSGAHGVVLVILGGHAGHGFAVQVSDPDFVRVLPNLLRDLAGQIEREGSA